MSQLDLLSLANSCAQIITSEFSQVIAITFATIVAIYYFLHQAGIRMKIFAFMIYTGGMLTYLGLMLMQAAVGVGVQKALRAIPADARELPIQYYLGIRMSWVGVTSSVLFNLVYWILWLGTSYLIFFWKRPRETML